MLALRGYVRLRGLPKNSQEGGLVLDGLTQTCKIQTTAHRICAALGPVDRQNRLHEPLTRIFTHHHIDAALLVVSLIFSDQIDCGRCYAPCVLRFLKRHLSPPPFEWAHSYWVSTAIAQKLSHSDIEPPVGRQNTWARCAVECQIIGVRYRDPLNQDHARRRRPLRRDNMAKPERKLGYRSAAVPTPRLGRPNAEILGDRLDALVFRRWHGGTRQSQDRQATLL